MNNLPMSHDNIRAILEGNVRPTELLVKIAYQLLEEVEAEAADCSTFGKAHEQAVEMLKTARAERDQANAETKRWRDVADALSVKLTGVTAEGLVAKPAADSCGACGGTDKRVEQGRGNGDYFYVCAGCGVAR